MPSLRKASFKRTEKEHVTAKSYKSVFIHLLDNNLDPFEITLKADMSGGDLLDDVCLLLGGVLEKDYFGLRYAYRNEEKRWLDVGRGVHHQIKKAKTTTLSLRVRHYPSNPVEDVIQDLVRYLFYLQLRRDLFAGNILVKGEVLTKLISLAIQAEHGEILEPTKEVILELVTGLNIVENINSRMVDEVVNVVIVLNGLDCKEAESQFLQLISQLESYGVEPYPVEDQTGEKLFLTMNHQGICTFSGEKRKHIFYWENISRMMFIRKSFFFDLNVDNKKRRLGFKFSSANLAKEFWKWALDRQYFMTLNSSSEAKEVKSNNVIFSRKVTHRFSGKSMKELTISCSTLNSIPQPPIVRTRNCTMTRSNSSKAICRHSVNLDSSETNPNSYATLPRRSNANKETSILSTDSEVYDEEKNEMMAPQSSEDLVPILLQETEEKYPESELPVIVEDRAIEEVVECEESRMVQSLFSEIHEDEQVSETEGEVRERRAEPTGVAREVTARDPDSVERSCVDCDLGSDQYRFPSTDGLFFIKFVVFTTVLLLAVMVTSLVAYYYYRSSTIADLNKQKYSSEWNKNIDLESIKRFVLRNDAP